MCVCACTHTIRSGTMQRALSPKVELRDALDHRTAELQGALLFSPRSDKWRHLPASFVQRAQKLTLLGKHHCPGIASQLVVQTRRSEAVSVPLFSFFCGRLPGYSVLCGHKRLSRGSHPADRCLEETARCLDGPQSDSASRDSLHYRGSSVSRALPIIARIGTGGIDFPRLCRATVSSPVRGPWKH